MATLNRNFFIAYALLVGLPLLGLLGVLKAGRHLRAPMSVDGVWKVEADAAAIAALPCLKPAMAEPENDLAVMISQSGKELVVGMTGASKITGSGVIDGNNIRASAAPSVQYSGDSGCGSDVRLALNATVDPNATPRTLAGKLWVEGCTACAPVEFHAVRKIVVPKKEVSH